MTPLVARSERTIFCTPIDNATWKWSKLLSIRYDMALSVNRDAKHFEHASLRLLWPLILRYVSCCPAKEAVGKSSAVAELLTATSVLGAYCSDNFSYACLISSHRSSGRPALKINSLADLPLSARSITLFLSRLPISSLSLFVIPDEFSTYQYASAHIANPLGVLTPLGVSSWYISPREAFFPPTIGTSSIPISFNHFIYFTRFSIIFY